MVTAAPPIRLAIIGAGPSGFYAASKILQTLPPSSPQGQHVQIDMYDRLPTPYGLARYGVAPDHPEVKNCQHKFDELALDGRFKFYGNVCVGNSTSPIPGGEEYAYPEALHVSLTSLYPYYNNLLFTYGSSHSTALTIPGSSASAKPARNVFPALAFVNWYNGHPAYTHLRPDLTGETVTIIGHGNVAVDCARVLLKPPQSFQETDMPTSIIEQLRKSNVKKVELVGRRGPGQVAFTTKEFREMINLEGIRFNPVQGDLLADAKAHLKGDRARTRLLDLIAKGGKNNAGDKEFELGFLKSPKAFLSSGQNVNAVQWDKNALMAPPAEVVGVPPLPPAAPTVKTAYVTARPTGEQVTTKTGMVIESVGYRAESIDEGVPFDQARSRLMNAGGRVTDAAGVMVPGMYTAGWLASGPIGVIASTMQNAYAVAATIIQDHYEAPTNASQGLLQGSPDMGVPAYLRNSSQRVVGLKDWERISRAEEEAGAKVGKIREKFTSFTDMLAVLD